MAKMMRAVRIHRFGGPEVMVMDEVPVPEPGPGEVLIRVRAAGTNPIDYKAREGISPTWKDATLPLVMGFDLSGEIVKLGPDVTAFKKRDEVFGMVRFPGIGATYAEYVTAPLAHIAKKPKGLDHEHAAAIPLAALTAWQSLFDHAGLGAGQSILVQSAAGGVGSFAVQFAKWKGAKVYGTTSTRNLEFVRDLGCDHPIDYTNGRFEDAIPAKVDVVFEMMGGEIRDRSWKVLKKDGVLVSIGGSRFAPGETGPEGQRALNHSVRANAEELAKIAELVESGQVKSVVDTVYPLAAAAEALVHVAGRHSRGKVVLRVS